MTCALARKEGPGHFFARAEGVGGLSGKAGNQEGLGGGKIPNDPMVSDRL